MLTRKMLEDAAKCNSMVCAKCSCNTDFGCEIEELAKNALAYRAMLERLEWSYKNDKGYELCPICKNYARGKRHKTDCELAALLKESEG